MRMEQLEVTQNKRQNAWQQFQTTKGKTKKVLWYLCIQLSNCSDWSLPRYNCILLFPFMQMCDSTLYYIVVIALAINTLFTQK